MLWPGSAADRRAQTFINFLFTTHSLQYTVAMDSGSEVKFVRQKDRD